MQWYIDALKNYVVFTGRSRRKAYWMFVLVNIIIAIILAVIGGVIGDNGLLGGLYNLAVLLPSIAIGIRRLHDTDRVGWWLLLALIPLVGVIILIVFYAQDSTPGPNRFGPNPKGA